MSSPTSEEKSLIRDAIIIKLVMIVFERDVISIRNSPIKTQSPYIDVIVSAWKRAHMDFDSIRTVLNTKGIRLFKAIQNRYIWEQHYNCRGIVYAENLSLLALKRTIESKMRSYLFNEDD